jgi:hypothetical protein
MIGSVLHGKLRFTDKICFIRLALFCMMISVLHDKLYYTREAFFSMISLLLNDSLFYMDELGSIK